MDLRNKAFTIQQQDMTFQQQLEAMRQQALLQVESYNKTSGQAQTTGATALANYNPTGGTYSAPGGTNQATSANQYVGQISPTQKKDQYGNPIQSSSW
jgi:hypothetical protein